MKIGAASSLLFFIFPCLLLVSCRVVLLRVVSCRDLAYLVLSLQKPTMWDGRGAIGAGAGFARPETHAMYDLPSAIGKQVVIVLFCHRDSRLAMRLPCLLLVYLCRTLVYGPGKDEFSSSCLSDAHCISIYSPTPEGRINRPSRLDPRARGPKAQQIKRLVLGPTKCGQL